MRITNKFINNSEKKRKTKQNKKYNSTRILIGDIVET